jgi:hypothetical protein
MWIRFSASAPGSADSTSDSTKDCEPLAANLARSAWWRGKPSPSRSWERRCRKGGWMNVLSGAEISETYPATNFRRSTGSPAAIPASHSPTLASEWEKTTLVICGQRSSTSSELFDPEESSSRTSPATCRSASIASFKTWRDAVTAVRSDCLRRRKSAHHTDASGSSSSGWPTPDCTMRPHEGNVRMLRRAVESGLPKDEADAMLGRDIGKPQGKLPAWPTPRASTGGADPETRATGKNLQNSVKNWPTPVAGDADKQPTGSLHDRAIGKGPKSHPGQLNPDWVEMLMGFPVGWTDCGLSGTR